MTMSFIIFFLFLFLFLLIFFFIFIYFYKYFYLNFFHINYLKLNDYYNSLINNNNGDDDKWNWQKRAQHYKYDPEDLDEEGDSLWPDQLEISSVEKSLIKNEYETKQNSNSLIPKNNYVNLYNLRIDIRSKDVVYSRKYSYFFKWYRFPANFTFHIRFNSHSYDLSENEKLHPFFCVILGYKSYTPTDYVGIWKHSNLWLNTSSMNFQFSLFESKVQRCLYQVLYYNYELGYLNFLSLYGIRDAYSRSLYVKLISLFNFLLFTFLYIVQLFKEINFLYKNISSFYNSYKLEKCLFYFYILYNMFNKYVTDLDKNVSLFLKYTFFLNKNV